MCPTSLTVPAVLMGWRWNPAISCNRQCTCKRVNVFKIGIILPLHSKMSLAVTRTCQMHQTTQLWSSARKISDPCVTSANRYWCLEEPASSTIRVGRCQYEKLKSHKVVCFLWGRNGIYTYLDEL